MKKTWFYVDVLCSWHSVNFVSDDFYGKNTNGPITSKSQTTPHFTSCLHVTEPQTQNQKSRIPASVKHANSVSCARPPQWGAADALIEVPSDENTELKGSPFQA